MDTNSEANSSRSQSSFQCQDLKMDRDEVISEEEAAAIAAAEAAHAAALAAAEVCVLTSITYFTILCRDYIRLLNSWQSLTKLYSQ